MLLPDRYSAWSRTRSESFLVRKNIRIKGKSEYGWEWDTLTPYVEGNAHITVDGAYSNWRWSRNLLRKDPVKYGYLKSIDFGGPFVSNHLEYIPPKYKVYHTVAYNWAGREVGYETNYGTPFPCFHSWQLFQHPLDVGAMPLGMEFDELWTLGGNMIARTMPTVPTMNLSVSVAELLREGLPKKLGANLRKGFSAKHVADEFLNYTFGYLPVLSDLQALALTLPRLEEKMKELVRNNGREIRRGLRPKTVVADESWSHYTYIFGGGGAITGYNTPRVCNHSVTRTTTTWFSAAYFYDLPTLPEISDRFAQMRYVLGLNLDAQTIWNLIPWSWLVGWLLPVEPVLQNLSVMARNNVRIQRAYIMCHSEVTHTADNGRFSATLRMSTKQRDRASPWGFGANPKALSATQLAILASLGLSRSNI